jgi:hypothetical protein
MTVGELGERMTSDEFTRWRAFYAYRAAIADKEARKASKQRGR